MVTEIVVEELVETDKESVRELLVESYQQYENGFDDPNFWKSYLKNIIDSVDNTDVDSSKLYTQPEEVAEAYEVLSKISKNFTIAAAFGNVHGVYKPGNVKLEPVILANSQKYIAEKFNTEKNPVNFVFHGGSGSEPEKIKEAISYGVIKMNIDTDTQWAYWDGVRTYEAKNHDYLQGQIGNPGGEDIPNKKYYDPRKWLRAGEEEMVKRLEQAFNDLNCIDRY